MRARAHYTSPEHLSVYSELFSTIHARRGTLLLTGEAGTGKTMLLERMADDLRMTGCAVHLFANAVKTFEEFLQRACETLGLDTAGRKPSIVLREVLDHQEVILALLVDEADALDDGLLQRIVEYSSRNTGDGRAVQVVLAGEPGLKRRLESLPLEHMVALRRMLHPLKRREVGPFIRHQLSTVHEGHAEGDAALFGDETVVRIARHSRGVPARINLLCERLLEHAQRNCAVISASLVDEIADQALLGRELDNDAESKAPAPAQVHEVLSAGGDQHGGEKLSGLVDLDAVQHGSDSGPASQRTAARGSAPGVATTHPDHPDAWVDRNTFSDALNRNGETRSARASVIERSAWLQTEQDVAGDDPRGMPDDAPDSDAGADDVSLSPALASTPPSRADAAGGGYMTTREEKPAPPARADVALMAAKRRESRPLRVAAFATALLAALALGAWAVVSGAPRFADTYAALSAWVDARIDTDAPPEVPASEPPARTTATARRSPPAPDIITPDQGAGDAHERASRRLSEDQERPASQAPEAEMIRIVAADRDAIEQPAARPSANAPAAEPASPSPPPPIHASAPILQDSQTAFATLPTLETRVPRLDPGPVTPSVTALVSHDASGAEDSPIALQIDANASPPEAARRIEIAGVPPDAVLSRGRQAQGFWHLTLADLEGLALTPAPNSDLDLRLSVTLVDTQSNVTLAENELHVEVQAVADTPQVSVHAADGDQFTPIPLEIEAALGDNDGSETLSVVIRGIPNTAALSNGRLEGDGTWILSASDLEELVLTPEHNVPERLELTITVVATESSNGDSATATRTLTLGIVLARDASLASNRALL